jgi:GNAT superfamily N-acetyltransferase
MSDVHFRAFTREDAPKINALFHTVFDKKRSKELWEWLYLESPGGPGVAVVGCHDETIIAHGGLIKRPFQLGLKATYSGQSIDAMTHPDWQRKGLNKGLQEHLRPLVKKAGVELIYGFSNENSTPGILRYQERTPLSPFPLLVRALRIPGVRDINSPLPPSRQAHIPEDYRPFDPPLEHRVGTLRSLEYLRWRYRKPGGIYREVVLREGGRLRGLGLLSIRKQGGMRVAFIGDFLAPREDPKTRKELLALMIEEAKSSGCVLMTGLAFPRSLDRPAYTRSLFLPVPKKLQMEDVVFSVRALHDGCASLSHQPDAWNLSWGSHDLV